MKNILIIYPHWVPANLAGVHRPRLIGNYLHEFDWKVTLLTVHSDYYEEKLDYDFSKTASPEIDVRYSKAFNVTKPRIIGDIGLRGFFQLKKQALNIIKEKKIDFIWIPIPSFYVAILGRILFNKTKIPYGIDYIDPWVRDISNRKNLRSRFSNLVAKILEPYAVKKASLISGVSIPYFQPVLDRNFKNKTIAYVGMPYGFDPNDHKIKLENIKYPWSDFANCIPIVYAGAFLPKSGLFTQLLFKSIKNLIDKQLWNTNTKLYFIGTGNYSHKSITEYAEEACISQYIYEIRERFAFLDILNFLSASKGVMVIGSTEKHYTASKIFQSLLSEKPVFSVFHSESSAIEILKEVEGTNYSVKYFENETEHVLQQKIETTFLQFINNSEIWNPDLTKLDKYSAKESARKLAVQLDLLTELGN